MAVVHTNISVTGDSTFNQTTLDLRNGVSFTSVTRLNTETDNAFLEMKNDDIFEILIDCSAVCEMPMTLIYLWIYFSKPEGNLLLENSPFKFEFDEIVPAVPVMHIVQNPTLMKRGFYSKNFVVPRTNQILSRLQPVVNRSLFNFAISGLFLVPPQEYVPRKLPMDSDSNSAGLPFFFSLDPRMVITDGGST